MAELCARYHAAYFLAPAGAGALLSEAITGSEVIAFADLGPEAVYQLQVRDLPVLVATDAYGCDVYQRRTAEEGDA